MCGDEDLAQLRVPQVEGRQRASCPGSRSKEFIQGPVPLPWWGRACELSGKALAVASAIWWVAGMKGKRDGLRLTSACLERFAVKDRSTKYRALRALVKAGLIRVECEQGKNPVVTILQHTT
jgi:hypothetical protein